MPDLCPNPAAARSQPQHEDGTYVELRGPVDVDGELGHGLALGPGLPVLKLDLICGTQGLGVRVRIRIRVTV